MMKTNKKSYRYSSGETFQADLDDLKRLLSERKGYLDNYQEVFSSLDDDDFVARGNGFCDRKYSDDFIEGQIAKYQSEILQLTDWIDHYYD